MRVLRFASTMVALCSVLSVIRVDSQSAPSSQATPSTQAAPPTQTAPSSQTPPSTPNKPHKTVWATNKDRPKPPPPAPGKLEHFDLNLVDKTLDPCQDFYEYACSKWNAANPIPKDQVAWGTGGGLEYWNEYILREVMQKAARQTGGGSDFEQKIGDYWAACMDEQTIEAIPATRSLEPGLNYIDRMASKSDLADQVAHIHLAVPGAWRRDDSQTRSALLGFGPQQAYDDATKVVASIDQGGLGLPNRAFYLKDDDKSKEILSAYEAHIGEMLILGISAETQEQAATDAKTVIAIESAMAQAQMDNAARRDPKNLDNKMTLKEVQALTPSFNWKAYLEAVKAPSSSPYYLVSSPQFFRNLESLIQQFSVDDWKVYLRWQWIHGSAPYLYTSIADENWAFYSHTLLGAKQPLPRWRRCVRTADRDLGMALGQAYVAAAFPPDSKLRAVAMARDIENALDRDITDVDWMQPATKAEAKTKLHTIENKVGYPDRWRDYSSLKITRGSYFENVHEATAFEFHRQLSKIGQPVDRAEWTMTPPTTSTYYDPQLNAVNLPAGILQPPYFDSTMDDAVNYGAIGMMIGREITQGVDDQGRRFDARGDLRDWWTADDAKGYEQRAQCVAHGYTEQGPEAGMKQNADLTRSEDTADYGGLRLAFMAVSNKLQSENKSLDAQETDGWTPRQKFFLSFAYSWCTQYSPELMRSVASTNPHSIRKYRVNNAVSNMPEFQQAFSCKKGSPMVRDNQCRVW
ncbi:MAG: M13 family metallopeptidase [Candidatus Sulfotelmatobacter sp.]